MEETAALEIPAPHRELLDQILDKWSLGVLNELCRCPRRFNELKRSIGGVTQKSLTSTLRKLERNGIIERLITSTRPLAVEYRITRLGKTIRGPIEELLSWTETHYADVLAARNRFEEELDPQHTIAPPTP